MTCEFNDVKVLPYEIHKYSSYSTSYLPENIRDNCPENQTSRWTSYTNNPPQYVTLILPRPAIVYTIKFGKYEKNHVCNLKKFQVFGGLKEDHLKLLFEGGLRNDSVPETFHLRHTTESGDLFPILYLQIMPLLSWSPSFNFTIWFVELRGQDDPIFVNGNLGDYEELRETEIVRLCLKHFRQQGYHMAFKALQEQTNIHLESSLMTELHDVLVENGNFSKTEEYVEQFVANGLTDDYCLSQPYKAEWSVQDTLTTLDSKPGMRGGHQLVIDSNENRIYLFGGWDGFRDLSDLWYYDMKLNTWTLIHEHAEKHDGPSPRSCHKMLFDPLNSQIFTLGRYLENVNRTNETITSDFYLYDIKTNSWIFICEDTSKEGGPQALFDHQMCLDVTQKTIYVFGGRIITPRKNDDLVTEPQYSGLYSYHVGINMWTRILVDCAHSLASNPDVLSIKSRVMHSMLFHHRLRKLFVFGGQRNKEYTPEFISIDVDSRDIKVISAEHGCEENTKVPQCGFTQRATIDCEKDEIYVLTSLSKEKERKDVNLNILWMYSLKTNRWTCIYRCNHFQLQCFTNCDQNACTEPCPRFAHQLVYDINTLTHYLFGGNPGKLSCPQLRLDDLWLLKLKKPTRQQTLQKYKFMIRKLEYEELARTDPLYAMSYLQTKISDIIDHKDPEQLKQFHKLAALLFQSEPKSQSQCSSLCSTPNCSSPDNLRILDSPSSSESLLLNYNGCSSEICCFGKLSPPCSRDSSMDSFSSKNVNNIGDHKVKRCLLFNRIVKLLPDHLVQPKGNLSDLVTI